MPDYSIGEVDSLVLKAYRGAGFSWGLAQEAGNAAAWMAMQGIPSLDVFSRLVQIIDNRSVVELTPLNTGFFTGDENHQYWAGPADCVCPVIAGLAFAECDLSLIDWSAGVVIENVLQPLVMTHFIARAADQLAINLSVTFAGGEIICSERRLNFLSNHIDQHASCTFRQSQVTIRQSASKAQSGSTIFRRATGLKSSINVLEHYAHRTYVPASEASRNSGAGAGSPDED